MKGQPDQLVERAILQGRREADSLYLLIIDANTKVLEAWTELDREYPILFGWLTAEMRGNPTKDRIEALESNLS
jgi:hypothetical protein